ncbi:MAG: hypothetical protein CL678_14080 [Bdellovibrionaceae bacterium]|nr:hypothetical protein [Pseudobdellovibrionaceae bacterium]|tara:strand:+ start:193 stop:501 length:309 start_codon:yes stop_codon:yes gene_type:complete
MTNLNIISLQAIREIKKASLANPGYYDRVAQMDKVALLEEMVRFQEERSKIGELTIDLIVRGKILFEFLSESAETEELQILSRSYLRHLHFELEEMTNAASR